MTWYTRLSLGQPRCCLAAAEQPTTFEVSSFADIDSWEKEPSLKNIEEGGCGGGLQNHR